MTVEEENNETNAPIKQFGRLPWFIALGALLLYSLTLNHWVTLSSLPVVAKITGWDWHPQFLDWRATAFTPLWDVVSSPAYLLPVGLRPLFLNFISATCAALTLMLLARSVRLLPHDRTRDQRVRELDDSTLLNDKYALIPQLLAVLALGLQRTFWENAIAATGEMLDVLIFAALIWCLLEFRHSRKESWMTRFVLLYGFGVTNNWALIGFFPFFLISIIWIKGLSFFSLKYVGRLFALGLPGLLLYFLVPAIAAMSAGGDFGHLLRTELSQQKNVLLAIPKWAPVLFSIPTLMTLFFIGIRWPSFQGDMSAIGSVVSDFGFRAIHIMLFAVGLWFFLDIKFSPRVLFDALPFMTFYYMAAIAVGYFCGFFLFVSHKQPIAVWNRRSPGQELLAKGMLGLVLIVSIAVPGWLIYSNAPKIQASNSPVLKQYATELARSIPAQSVVLSDDHSRLLLAKAGFQALGKAENNIMIETDSLQYSDYLGYLSAKHPVLKDIIGPVTNLPPVIDSLSTLRLVMLFNEKAKLPIYYLHPSFGFFFEHFNPIPRGLVNELKPYPAGMLDKPALSDLEIAANLEAWKKLRTSFLDDVTKQRKLSPDAEVLGWFCSRTANTWGVELQQANRLKDAEAAFKEALDLYPRNRMALANQRYNLKLQEKNTQPLDNTELIRDARQQYRSWQGVLSFDGPTDEPDLLFRFGQELATGGNFRQAYQHFQRRLALRPDDFDVQLALAKTFADMRMPDKAIGVVRRAENRASSPAEKAELLRVEALSYVIQTNWSAAENLLVNASKQSPQDERRVGLLVEYYRIAGVLMLQNKESERAQEQFKKALTQVSNLLVMLKNMGRNGSQDEADALLKQSELQIQLGDYAAAAATLTVLLDRQPDSPTALVNRAIAELKLKKYAEAKRDYERLAKLLPAKAAAVCYGLGEVAYNTNNKQGAIKHFKDYLKIAPPNAPDYELVTQRLASLGQGR